MTTNQNRWRERLRVRGFAQLVDEAVAAAGPEADDLIGDEVEHSPRLARGIVWSDIVAEMEQDRLRNDGFPQAA